MKTHTHNPRKDGNPFLSSPDGRYPYAPEPGELVTISYHLGEGAGKGEEILLRYSVNSGESCTVEGERGKSEWRFSIGPFSQGDHVQYRFSTGDERFAFYVAKAHLLDEVTLPIDRTDKKEIRYRFSNGVKVTRLLSISEELPNSDGSSMRKVDLQKGTFELEELRYLENEVVLYEHPDWVPRYRLKRTWKSNSDYFVGFGERFNGVNQRGKELTTRVYEEYKKQYKTNRTYMPVPFFMTEDRWGHHVETFQPVRYDLGKCDPENCSITIPVADWDRVSEHFFLGTPDSILQQYSGIGGKAVTPPSWVFGPWMSSNEWDSQERTIREIEKSKALDIPFSVLVLEAWSDEKNFYIWNDATYKPKRGDQNFTLADFTFPEDGKWPDPAALVDTVHEMGAKILLWQIPVLKQLEEEDDQNSLDKEYMIEKGFAIRTDDQEPYRVQPWWFTHGLVPDFTNQDVRSWWCGKRRYLLDELGVDGFKTDGGEHLWGCNTLASGKERGDELANKFVSDYLETYYDFVNEKGGVLFSRAGFSGSQKTPIHWCGDQNSSWEEYASILSAVLSAGLSGIPFLGWDIGGFSGEIPSAELYIRSTQFACFGTLMQFHSEFNNHREPNVDRSPWNIGERRSAPEVVEIYRYYAKLRMQLIPYLHKSAIESMEKNLPLMRPFILAFPDKPELFSNVTQYLLGPNILVAPVLESGAKTVTLAIPDAGWHDGWSGEVLEEGEIEYPVEIGTIPVFYRPDTDLESIFPLSPLSLGEMG